MMVVIQYTGIKDFMNGFFRYLEQRFSVHAGSHVTDAGEDIGVIVAFRAFGNGVILSLTYYMGTIDADNAGSLREKAELFQSVIANMLELDEIKVVPGIVTVPDNLVIGNDERDYLEAMVSGIDPKKIELTEESLERIAIQLDVIISPYHVAGGIVGNGGIQWSLDDSIIISDEQRQEIEKRFGCHVYAAYGRFTMSRNDTSETEGETIPQ